MDITHNYPMPKKTDLQCPHGHRAKAVCESPIRCPACGEVRVLWVTPPPIKCKATVGIALGAANKHFGRSYK